MANFQRVQYGELQAIEVKGKPGAPTIVFFHGYGADAGDLAPLARALGLPPEVNWLFPNGLLAVPHGGYGEGRAWFPISISQLEKSGQPLALGRDAPPGLRKAREAALGALQAAGIRLSDAIVGGFSQGAMLAMDIALRGPEAPQGVALLSGTLLDEANWRRLAAERAGSTFFQSHGGDDPILAVEGAARLEALLLESGWQGKLLRFEGGHEIPLEAQSSLSVYLRSRIVPPRRP